MELEINIDYIVFTESVRAGNGTVNKKEYILTTETAQHIVLASRTAKGREVRKYFIQVEREFKRLMQNPNIHELSGRVGGLTRSNNELRKELDKWKKKSKRRFENLEDDVNELKKRPIMITHKGLDEKLEILFRKSDIPQQWAINQVENEKKKRVEVEKELSIIKWRFEIMLEKMTNLQNLAKNIVNF